MNKNGWGLRAELGFVLLFIVCILFSTIGLQKMGLLGSDDGERFNLGEYTEGKGNYDYTHLENTVVNAARRYYQERYPYGLNDSIVVSINALKSNGYMSPIYDSRNRECKGYAMILRNGTCVSYIKCSTYRTPGYNSDYE